MTRRVQQQTYNLDDLLEKVTPENIQSEVPTGEAVGKEVDSDISPTKENIRMKNRSKSPTEKHHG